MLSAAAELEVATTALSRAAELRSGERGDLAKDLDLVPGDEPSGRFPADIDTEFIVHAPSYWAGRKQIIGVFRDLIDQLEREQQVETPAKR